MKITVCLLFLTLFFAAPTLLAQDADLLLKEGVSLSKSQNYTAAVAKFKTALQIQPDNAMIAYQLGFALNASGKPAEALPYLQKVVAAKVSPQIISSAFELMGAIYDRAAQPKKAISSYEQGIAADSAAISLKYNLGLAYFRDHQYQKAAQKAVAVIAAEPENAPAYRLYALVCFHQDKRAAALLGFCSFLYLEPASAQSAEAYGNLQHILAGGTLKNAPGEKQIPPLAATKQLNLLIAKSAAIPRGKQGKTPYFIAQLDAVFTTINIAKRPEQDNLSTKLADYYLRLEKSGNLPAFGYFIAQSVDQHAAVWLQNHPQETTALKTWVKEAQN